MDKISWSNVSSIDVTNYTCGHCGLNIAAEKGWMGNKEMVVNVFAYLCICPNCSRPTFIDLNGERMPGSIFGQEIEGISEETINVLYSEARKSFSGGNYTASVLCSRKILMHLAVLKGDKEGKPFIQYVEYLSEKNFIPPDSKGWVDIIRQMGNEANHEIKIMSEQEGKDTLILVEMLLKIIFEFPSRVNSGSQ